jgi:hypothetical protein
MKPNIALAHILSFTGASVLSDTPILGEITVANSSQNYAGSLAQDITGYLAGPTSPDEEDRFNLLFPGVQTNDFFQFAKADDEAYLTEADDSDIRNAGASFKRVQYRGTTVTDSTIQKGLTIRVDHKRLAKLNGVIIPGWEQRYAAQLKKRLIRADKVRGLALLDAAATNANVTWSSSSNPDGDLRAMVQLTRTGSGMLPTHVVLGNAAMQARQDAYEAGSRTNELANHAAYTMEALARYLGSRQVILEDGIKQTAKGAAKADVLGLVAYSYSAEESPMLDDPSNIKRAWSPVLGGGEWGVAIQESAVYTDITVWHDSKIFVPLTAGIRKSTVSLS